MKKVFLLLSVLSLFILMTQGKTYAQLSGPKTIPGDYATIALAVADLNTQGVGTGGVIFNVAAGYTESITSVILITATGTSSNPIVFQKSGTGANPVVTRTDAGTLTTSTLGGQGDAILIMDGSDYITFNGIDITAANSGIEYGYYLRKLNPTDGCKNVTIKNSVVTMTKGTSGFVTGIYSSNNDSLSLVSSATGITVTSTGGRNENVTMTGNTIQNVHTGILLRGYNDISPYSLYDQNFVIGASGAANIIQNYGGGSATASYAVYLIYHNNSNVSYNIINNTAGGGANFTSTGYGIFHSTSTNGSGTYNNNQITLAATTGQLRAIMSGTSGVATLISNNNAISLSQASTSEASGIYFQSLSAGSNTTINNNTFSYLTFASTGTSYLIFNGNGANNVTVTGNNSSGTITKTGAGAFYGYYSITTTATSGTCTINNNNFSNIVLTGASIFGGIYNTTSFSHPIIITNNTISNVTGGTSAVYGIYEGYGAVGSTVNGNNVFGLTATTGAVYGIYTGAGGVPSGMTVYNNSIYNLSSSSTLIVGLYNLTGALTKIYQNKIYNLSASNASGAVYGIQLGGVNASTYVYTYNNFISDLKSPICNSTTDFIRGINITNTGTTSTFGLYYNTIYLNATSTGTNFATTGVFHTFNTTATTAALDMRNNVVVNASTQMGTGITAAFRRSASTNLNNFLTASNNNCFFAGTPGTYNLIYFDGTNSDQTMAAYQTRVTPRETISFRELPPFVNVAAIPYDLHIQTTIATQCEKGGTPVTSPIAITDDYDVNVRNTIYPDVGADEFAGIMLDLFPPVISYIPLGNTGSIGNRTLNVTVTDPSGVPSAGPGWPNLYWRIGTGSWTPATPFSVSGSIYTYQFGTGVTLGDVVSYYIVARDMATTPNIGAFPSAGAGGFTYDPPAASTPPTNPNTYTITNTALFGDYTVGLLMFNKIAGKNITFEKVIKKVMKEVPIDEEQKEITNEKDKAPRLDDESMMYKLTGSTKMVEVEEISWVPMENGKEYKGDLYIKKSENPNYNYPMNTMGVYATITAAIADLNLRGVSGPTRFLLTDASYTTGETYPIVVNVTSGDVPTATNTVTIKPNTGVTSSISGAAASTHIFAFLTKYVTLDGSNSLGGTTRDLTVQNTSVTTPRVILIGSTGTTPITNVTLKNCTFINGTNGSSAVVVSDGAAPGNAGWFNNITIQNNSIQLAYIALYCISVVSPGNGSGLNITGNDVNTLGTNSVRLCVLYVQGVDGATLTNNNLGNMINTTDASNLSGIWLATGASNITISGNNIIGMSGTSTGPRGIAISTGVNPANINITGNVIDSLYTSSSGVPYGIYVFSNLTTDVSIKKNKISRIQNSNTGGYGARGINLLVGSSSSNIEIINNFVWDVKATADAGVTYWGIGIAIDGTTGGVNVYFNSVNLFDTLSGLTAATVHAAFYSGVTTSNLNVRDNIFVNSFDNTNSTIDKSYAINHQGTSASFSDINYNDYFVSGTQGVLGFLISDRLTISDWRTATGKDLNSVSGDPQFISNTDLHINTGVPSPVNNAGQFIASVPDDIDGNPRSLTTPDIGGDEYTYIPPAPVAPTLLLPTNGATGVSVTPVLDWDDVPTADSYRIQLSTNSGFTTTAFDTSGVAVSQLTVPAGKLNNNTQYYWRVNATNLGGTSPWSTVWNFTTILAAPIAPTLLLPTNGATGVSVTPLLDWNDVPSAASYQIQLSTNSGFTTTVYDTSVVAVSQLTVPAGKLNNNTQYYWRVNATNVIGTGPWSTVWNFTTIMAGALTGIKYIPGDYASIQLAITDLNTVGVGTGGVTFNIAAGTKHTETIPPGGFVINITNNPPNASNPVVFQRNGTGANPLISSDVAGSATAGTTTLGGNGSAFFKLIGTDYITFSGLTIQELHTGTTQTLKMQYGFMLVRSSATDGCKNVTINNCVINMQQSNVSSCGIATLNVNAAHTTTSPTSIDGRHENISVQGCTINNSFNGMYFVGYSSPSPYDLFDHFYNIGTTTANTLINIGSGLGVTNTSTHYGIYSLYLDSIRVNNNTIRVNTGTNNATSYGVFLSTALNSSADIIGNTISDTAGGTTSQLSAITCGMGGTGTNNVVNINNNIVQYSSYFNATTAANYYIYNSTNPFTLNITGNTIRDNVIGGGATATGIQYPIWSSLSNSTAGSTYNIASNTIKNLLRNQSAVGSGTTYCIYVSGAGQTTNINGNIVDSVYNASTGAIAGIYYTPIITEINVFGNTVSNIAKLTGATTGAMYGIYQNNSSATSNNYNNTIFNLGYIGTTAAVYGYYNNGSGTVAENVYNNTVYNLFSNTSGIMIGIQATSGGSPVKSVYGNTVYNLNAGTGQTGGIQVNYTVNADVYRNKIYKIRTNNTTSSPAVYGMLLNSSPATAIYNVFNNMVHEVYAPVSGSGLGVLGIWVNGGDTANITYNSLYLDSTSTGTNFGAYALYFAGTTNATLKNNIVVNKTVPVGTGVNLGIFKATTVIYNTTSNNNNIYVTPGPNNHIYYDGTTTYQTFAAFQAAVAPAETNSFTENSPFINTTTSPYNLHLSTTIPTLCESGAQRILAPIAIPNDIDNDIRWGESGYTGSGTAPDVGADEFAGIRPPAPIAPTLSLPVKWGYRRICYTAA